jgi:hypothetical protein
MSRARVKTSSSPGRKSAKGVTKASASSINSVAKTSPKVAAFIRKHWPEKGRAESIAGSERAWQEAVRIASTFKKIDDETWKWIAQSKELEDI